SRSRRHLSNLLRTRLEQVRIAEPVCGICLRVPAVEGISESQAELFDTEGAHSIGELPILLDHLTSRLGHDAVTFARLIPDPQPESACRFETVVERRWTRGEGRGENRNARGKRTSKKQAREILKFSPLAPHPSPLVHRPLQLWPRPAPIAVRAVVPEGPPFQ